MFASFSRWECALKHNKFVRVGQHGQAEADWKKFANEHGDALAKLTSDDFLAARKYLTNSPPQRQELRGGHMSWEPNPKRSGESEADYLFRVVKDVRNNLFHGGKFVGGPAPELARDRLLIDSAIVVLEGAAVVHPGVDAMLHASV